METKTFSGETSGKTNKRFLIRFLKWSIGIGLLLALLGVIGVGGILYYYSRDLPSLDSLGTYAPSQSTRIYSDDNRVIGEFYIEKRVYVPISQMPKHLVQAILAVEDSRFYEHQGYDVIRIVRAAMANIESGRIRQGASTITQQLTRSLFLTPERTMERKIKELLLSLKVEKVLSKDEILEIYLNHIYFGHGAYGVQVASLTYFGKNVADINLEEAAFLAGLPKAPNDYSPYRNPERAKFRQRIVLKRMVDEGHITQAQYRGAYERDMIFKKLNRGHHFARYFKEYVRQYLIARYGDDVVYKGGLKVYTSLNEKMQAMAETALTQGLRQLDKRQGYRGPIGRYEAVAAEEKKGQIRESGRAKTRKLKLGDLLSARVLSLSEESALVEVLESGEEIATIGKILLKDMVWAARRLTGPDVRKDRTLFDHPIPADLLAPNDLIQVGVKSLDESDGVVLFALEQEPIVQGAFVSLDPSDGTVKALVGGYDFGESEYNRAVMSRRQPGSAFKPIIYGTAIDRGYTAASILIDNPVIFTDDETQKVWKPENYEKKFYGKTTMRDALTHSRNLATVKLLREIGIRPVVNYAKKLGIESSLTRDLSLALGSSGVSLLELTSALGVYANEGLRIKPALVLTVTDSAGHVLETRDRSAEQVISKEAAYVITNILEDVVQRGTAKRARKIGRPVAGKTGTTNEFTDAWFVGYTPNLASGVWVGFDNNQSLGYKESGGRAALPIWVSYMENALALLPVVPFKIPDEIVYAKIDRASGMLARDGEPGEYEIFVNGTEPTEVKQEIATPSEFFRFDQEDSF